MNILEARLVLTDFFQQNDIFNYPEDIAELEYETGDPSNELDADAILLGLKDFETAGLLQKADDKNKFILTQPLSLYEQSVLLKGNTILTLTKIVNSFCNELEDDINLVDPLSIKERDIQNILLLLNSFLDKNNPTGGNDGLN